MKILIIDESSDTCDMLRYILEPQGHTVHCAEDVGDGLLAVHQHRPDIVMIDLHTPGLPVDKFVHATHADCPATEIIVMSGMRTVVVHADTLKVGHYLHKPFTPEEVLDAIRSVTPTTPGVKSETNQRL